MMVDITVAVWRGRRRWAEAEQCPGGRHSAAVRGWFTAAVTSERRRGGGRWLLLVMAGDGEGSERARGGNRGGREGLGREEREF